MSKRIIIFILFIPFLINGQKTNYLNDTKSFSSFEFKWSNDFEYQTDYYYTNGFAFEVFSKFAKINVVNSILFPFKLTGKELFSFTLTQDIFTPKEMAHVDNQLNGDRPFAANILFGIKKVTFNKADGIRTYSELQIGVLGPAALGEETQNGIHNNLPTSGIVKGWENQISNSLMLNYSTFIEKYFFHNNWFELSGISKFKFGLPYTCANVGMQTRIGLIDLLPKDFEFISSKKWQFFLTLSAEGSVVAYNATLQGGMFSESIYTLNSINTFVGYSNVGLTLIYKKFKMEYVQHFNSPEFTGAEYHSWGYLLFKVGF